VWERRRTVQETEVYGPTTHGMVTATEEMRRM